MVRLAVRQRFDEPARRSMVRSMDASPVGGASCHIDGDAGHQRRDNRAAVGAAATAAARATLVWLAALRLDSAVAWRNGRRVVRRRQRAPDLDCNGHTRCMHDMGRADLWMAAHQAARDTGRRRRDRVWFRRALALHRSSRMANAVRTRRAVRFLLLFCATGVAWLVRTPTTRCVVWRGDVVCGFRRADRFVAAARGAFDAIRVGALHGDGGNGRRVGDDALE